MCDQKSLILSKSSLFSAMIAAVAVSFALSKSADALPADDVLNKMSTDQGISYINGVVEGLATSRWVKDKPDATGVRCINNWYYQKPTKTAWKRVLTWLERHPEQQVGILMHILIEKECPSK